GHRDAIGTRVRVEAGDTSRVVELTSGDGYLASNQRVLLLGLGGEMDAVRVEVMWPGRASQVFDELAVDREWTLVEGRGRAISLPRPIE
ncbi:MAG: ASPIC/UnbV domain-containing protein, partial [Planctomycetota bacterium]|nr:ASPIC/UnbV domain-containing protein [Planctomycetota bacterium]